MMHEALQEAVDDFIYSEQGLQEAVNDFIHSRTTNVVIEGEEGVRFKENEYRISSLLQTLSKTVNDEEMKLILQLESAMNLAAAVYQSHCYKQGFKDAKKLLSQQSECSRVERKKLTIQKGKVTFKELRERSGLSIEEVSATTGLHTRTIEKAEIQCGPMFCDVLIKLCNLYDVSLDLIYLGHISELHAG